MIFTLTSHDLAAKLAQKCQMQMGDLEMRQFPDKETYIKINSDVANKKVIIVESTNDPDSKSLPLMLLAETLRDLGAKEIGFVSPYLGYMRQDKRFKPGEGVTSKYYAKLISSYFDWLITIDAHVHRYESLAEIYSIPANECHAAQLIAQWIRMHVKNPLIVGPDSESHSLVETVAHAIEAPSLVLSKQRLGDRKVIITAPNLKEYLHYQPVLVDDIISSAHTMIEAIKLFPSKPICVAVHAVFGDDAFEKLTARHPQKIISCNTIPHSSNAIDVSDLLADAIKAR